MNVIFNGTAMYPNQHRQFPVKWLNRQTPCIVASAAEKFSHGSGESIFVFSSMGGRTVMHPFPEVGKALCEIHPGDIVAVFDNDVENDLLTMYTYGIAQIGPVLANGIPIEI